MANGKLHSVTLTSLTCNGTSDPLGGNDEVYILYQADGGPTHRYPLLSANPNTQSMNGSPNVLNGASVKEWGFSITVDFDYEVLVSVWDQDLEWVNTVSEFLINCDYRPDNAPSSLNMTNHNGANYTIAAVYHG